MKFTDIETNNNLKNDFFEEKSEVFNGKYTSLTKVIERVTLFHDFLISGDIK